MACLVDSAEPTSAPRAPMNSLKILTPSNGAPNDSRSLKLRKFGDFMEGRISQYRNIKRWDGAARTSTLWDSLRRDPELWYKNGNCLVHLYRKGQSRRGPAFKVPLGPLLAARCQPLINKYLSREVADCSNSELEYTDCDLWDQSDRLGKVELYIPPPTADKARAFQFRLAIRNFFAWVYRRAMVGEHLGAALIELMDNMAEFRSPGVDIVEDTMNYLDEEGYLDMANQPAHALAVLHLAEKFQLKDPYIEAFAHCAGMSEQLYTCAEYQCISTITRKLIRTARADMDSRLSRARLVLSDFLEDELSVSSLGLSAGGRLHLERFRAFLLAFYTATLGYYPPPVVDMRNTMWTPVIYQKMRADFEALYAYLVDETFTIAGSSPFLAERGMTVLHFVNAFDIRHRYSPLPHPLPLLPETSTTPPISRTMSWFGRGNKLRPDQRLVAHAALIKASNKEKTYLLQNSLVIAYKRFEEDSVCSRRKTDLKQKISHADARKVRWVLIYGMLQTLRSCTEVPPEVRDTTGVSYSLAIPTAHLPPWKEVRRQPSSRPMSIMSSLNSSLILPVSRTTSSALSCRSTPALVSTERRCDIDTIYAPRQNKPSSRRTFTAPPVLSERPVSRAGNLIRHLSGTVNFRHSLAWLKGSSSPSRPQTNGRRQSVYHEIILDGYGNGTNHVDSSDAREPLVIRIEPCSPKPTTPRSFGAGDLSPSTASSGTNSASYGCSDPAEATTPHTDYSPTGWTYGEETVFDAFSPPSPCLPRYTPIQELDFGDIDAGKPPPPPPLLISSAGSCSSSVYSTDDPGVRPVSPPVPEMTPPVPRRSSQRRRSLVLLLCELELGDLHPSPLRIRKEGRPAGSVPSREGSDAERG